MEVLKSASGRKESEDIRSEICQSPSTARQSQMPEARYSLVKLQKSPELSRSCSPVVHPPVLASKVLNLSDQTRPDHWPVHLLRTPLLSLIPDPPLRYPVPQPNPTQIYCSATLLPSPSHVMPTTQHLHHHHSTPLFSS